MSDKYILDGQTPVLCDDLLTWAKWFETAKCHVAKTTVGDVEVSTVFLGVNYNFRESGPPILFETMVFGGRLNQEQDHYATWQEAKQGHQAMVERATHAQEPQP